ncbi:MAG: peptide chain release factor 2 [Dehalococcoidia bacterium]|nr:peptide chain release factor 2 [Dehalococcoidia bacterium]
MFDLASDEATLAVLERESADPEFWEDPENARKVMQRISSIRSRSDTWRGLQRRALDTVELLKMGIEEGDDSVAPEAEAELDAIEAELAKLDFELQLSGEYDRRNAILAVHAGAGGTDAQDWAEMLLRMYLRWCEGRGFETEVLDVTEGDEAGIKSATVEVRGDYAFGLLESERGVHRLVRISPYSSANTRETSFAKVEVIPEVEAAGEIEVDPDDIRIDVFRASGHGGQNVQKNSTAIRITHHPSGIVVTCQNERSQGRNRESAMKVLESRLLEIELQRREEERLRLKGEHVEMGWGNQIRSYVLHPYKMVKDHRSGFESSDPNAVLDGDLDAFIEAFLQQQVGEES